MTSMDDPDGLGYATRDGRVPKLVVVAIVWAVFGLVGLFAAILLRSSGFAVFGFLCVIAGGGLYFVQRTRDQLAHDEMHLSTDPMSPPSGGDLIDEDDAEPAPGGDTTGFGRPERDDDILDAEFTEYFDYDQSPADQDDGTGYDDEEVAYQRYQADQRTRESEAADAEHQGEDEDDDGSEDSEDDDVARTSRIRTGGGDTDDEDDDLSTREYGDHGGGRR